MPSYRYLVGELNPSSGNGLREEIPFSTVKFSQVLNRTGGFSASLPLRHPKATRANLDPGRTAIHIDRDGVIVWSGILWVAEASTDDDAELKVGGQEWWSYFHRRKIRTTKQYLAVDQLAITRDLLTYAQAQPGGDIGVVIGSETCGVLRDRMEWYHYLRKNIAEAIEQLAGVRDGFDFAIDVAYEAGTIVKRFRPSYPRRGRITPLVWELGTNLEGLSQEVDATRLAGQVDALGAGEGDAMLIATAAVATPGYPLLEDVVTFKDVSTMATLADHAVLEAVARAQPVMRIPTLLARQQNPDTMLGTFVTGDSVQVRGSDGWISVDERMRIMGYEVTVDEDGKEEAAVSFAQEEASIT